MKKLFLVTGIALFILMAGCSEKNNKSDAAAKNKSSQGNENYQVTFIELGSVNCVPCRMMQPIMDEIEKEYAGKVKVVFHDVWTPEGKEKARPYKIRVIPTQVFLDKDGNEYYRHEGFFPKEELVKVLEMKLK